MTSRRSLPLGLGSLILLALLPLGVAAEAPPRLAPGNLDNGAFLSEASAYLQEHRGSPEAAGVLLEMYVAATLQEHEDLRDRIRLQLLVEQFHTPQARYIATTFEDAKAFRDFVLKVMDDHEGRLVRPAARGLVQAVRLGVNAHGEAVLDDAKFALRMAVLADIADAKAFRDHARRVLEARDDAARQGAAAALLLGDLSATEKIARLDAMTDLPDLRFLQTLLITQLSEAERNERPVLKVRTANALADGDFETALAWLDRLEPEDDADQLRFWRGWARLATRQLDQGVAELRELRAADPDSPWSALAESVLAGAEQMEAFEQTAAEAVGRMVDRLEGGVGVLTADAELRTDALGSFDIDLRLVPARNTVALAVAREGTMVLGYEVTGAGTRVYIDGEPNILLLEDTRLFPAAKLKLTLQPAGGLDVDFEAFMIDNMANAAAANRSLLESPLLTTPGGRLSLVRALLLRRGLPVAVEQTDAGTTLTWVSLEPRKPEAEQHQIHIASDGGHLRFQRSDLLMVRLSFGDLAAGRDGDADAIAFAPPPWPDLPVKRDNTQFALASLVGRGISIVGQWMAAADGAPAGGPATEPAATP